LYAELYAAARAGDADGCICSFYECYEEEAKTILIRYPFLPPLSIGQTQVFASVMLPLFTGRLHSFTWNKLYRRSLLLQYNVQSPEDMQLMEDALFNQDALGIMERVAYVDRPLYYYRRHPASVTMNFRADLFDTLLRLLWARERYLRQTTAPPHAVEQVNGWFIDELLRAFQAECSAARRMPATESTRRIRRMVNDADVRRLLPASQAGRNPFERALLLAVKLRSIVAVRVAAFSLRLARMALRWLKETAVARLPGRRQMMPEGGERL
jgi:glycosyltransferase EpsH